MKKYLPFILQMTFVLCVLMARSAMAGTGGTEFANIYTQLVDWAQGYLGKVLAIGAFLIGVAMGIVRQSLLAIVVGIATAIAVYYTPEIIDNMANATIM